jgi:hypothetical protein
MWEATHMRGFYGLFEMLAATRCCLGITGAELCWCGSPKGGFQFPTARIAATEENARCSALRQQGLSEVGETGRLLPFPFAARQYLGASSSS